MLFQCRFFQKKGGTTCFLLFISFLAFELVGHPSLFCQPASQWKKLPYTPSPLSRINDGYFVSPSVGWVVNGAGQIQRTTNAGMTWLKQLDKSSSTHFRSVGFIDSLHGWAGCLGVGDPNHPEVKDSTILYQTSNAGLTWTPVTALNSSTARGFCGMHVLNKSVINAVGRVRGPAYFYRTTDGGQTWDAKNMSTYAAGLIDVYFFDPDSGFAVGLTNTNHDNSSGVVLFTSDGGKTWQQRIQTSRVGEWCWKISFPSRKVGYVSLQRNSQSNNHFLKTTDGGVTWTEKVFPIEGYFIQGIGFANDMLGWIGGLGVGPMYESKDGGESWYPIGLGARINRFRLLGSTLGYAVGDSVYKYESGVPVSVAANGELIPASFKLKQNYPNPFNPSTTIHLELTSASLVRLRIYDVLGKELITLINQMKSAGSLEVLWDGKNREGDGLPSGMYLYRVEVKPEGKNETLVDTKRMLFLR